VPRERPLGASEARTPRLAAALAAVAVLLAPGAAGGLECPAPAGADARLASMPAEQRIAFLRTRLDAGRPSAEAWSWTWGVVNGALTAGQLAAIPFAGTSSGRWTLAASAASSALGVVQVLTLPIVPERLPDEGGGCAEVARLEGSLDRSARNVDLATGWVAQLGNVLINGAVATAAGFADHSWRTAALSFGIGCAIGEAEILTTPTAYVGDLRRYRAADLGDASPAAEAPRWAASPAPGVARGRRGGGISIVVRF
jgi:hypothetical protein